ncbi:DNA polymerase delta subunit 4 isoform X1 [Gadus morhua]|uniref:DNA polymerase delta 4, accessory subunit n=2 Tax=Gadus morhua TaxID=8049 RepID=A0A8C4ZVN6_GADMO|nr:DNA polymerase delta subunit 4 isoform X1 [Gadus morhua]
MKHTYLKTTTSHEEENINAPLNVGFVLMKQREIVLITMTTKRRLITDSFMVVKKRRHVKREKRPPSPPQNETETITEQELELQELKQFDLDWKYGPCTGISRLQRWERAQVHGLNPPQEIRELLLRTNNDLQFTRSLWSDYPL